MKRHKAINIELVHACLSLDFDKIKQAVESGADVNVHVTESDFGSEKVSLDEKYTTPLQAVVVDSCFDHDDIEKVYEIVKYLLEHGAHADADAEPGSDFFTPLFQVAWLAHDYELCKLLLEYEANPDAVSEGETILDMTCCEYNVVDEDEIPKLDEVVELLESHGALYSSERQHK
jgi:hypothetical protein